MLIDDIQLKIKAGDGGKGAVAFNKTLMTLGPAGGSGGRGGNVYAEGVSDLSALNHFRFKKEFSAENGEDGRSQFRDGHEGQDLILKLPVGTVIHNLTNNFDINVEKIGERILLAKSGIGGKGNFKFRSPTNTSPKEFKMGTPGEEFDFRFELKFIADIGLIGLPNVGKSSFLNELTNAKSKVANYPFTTLEPNLGVYYELILADIPGLIEGSSTGKGLGIKFLRHIERTKILFHFISAESPSPLKDYKIIKKELKAYNKELAKKKEYIFISKTDTVPEKEVKKKIAVLKKINKNACPPSLRSGVDERVFPISIYDWDSLENVKKILNKLQSEK